MGRRKKLRKAALRVPGQEAKSGLGVYEAHISPLQRRRLADMPPGLEPEIQLLRAIVDDCLRRMQECRDEGQRRELFEAAMKALQRLLTAARARDAQSKARASDLLDEAIEWVQAELGLEG